LLARDALSRLQLAMAHRAHRFTVTLPGKAQSVFGITDPPEEHTMSKDTAKDLERKLWKALDSDRTLMLGLDGVEGGHSRPMTAQVENERSPIWFFSSRDTALVRNLGQSHKAIAAFSSKGHDLFASISGTLHLDDNRSNIERLWNPFIAAWFDGKDDPKLALLRLDATHAEVWLNENNLLAGVKMLLGMDPKDDYQDKTASVDLR
jgi:general stress protein 26